MSQERKERKERKGSAHKKTERRQAHPLVTLTYTETAASRTTDEDNIHGRERATKWSIVEITLAPTRTRSHTWKLEHPVIVHHKTRIPGVCWTKRKEGSGRGRCSYNEQVNLSAFNQQANLNSLSNTNFKTASGEAIVKDMLAFIGQMKEKKS